MTDDHRERDEEERRSSELFLHLVGFVLELEGKPVGEHLRGG